MFALRTLQAVKDAFQGRRSGVITKPSESNAGRLRHLEYDDEVEHENILIDIPALENVDELVVDDIEEIESEDGSFSIL